MPYERSRKIEERFQEAIALIRKSHLNAERLASELGVSRPTVQRIVTGLRQRGYSIRSIHDEHGWRYEIQDNSDPNTKANPKRT
jgi:biotin operon repressor